MTRLGPGEEFDLIRGLLERSGSGPLPPGVRVGPGDDALVLEPGAPLVISTDLTVEGVHFRRDWIGLREAAYRAVAVAVSDLAGMASRPVGVLISLALPAQDRPDFDLIAAGIADGVAAARGSLLGGDLTASPGPLVFDVVALGECREPLERGGARAGDELWVTGPLGGAAAAVRSWQGGGEPEASLRRAFAAPVPRWREAEWLRERVPLHAGLDLSDGLAGDAAHLAAASGVGVELDAPSIPVAEGARLDEALHGGEDYELLLALPPGRGQGVAAGFHHAFGTNLTRVGRVGGPTGLVSIVETDGTRRPLERGGFDHFRRSESP